MPNYNAVVSLASTSGDSADINVNGFAVVDTGALDASDQSDWADALVNFYDALEVLNVLKGRAQNGHTIKIYAADTGVPNYPIYETSFNLTAAPGPVEMPEEVALCISYANDSQNSVPRARRRGRIYISGFTESSNDTGRPATGTYTALPSAFNDYVDEVNLIADVSAGIWSRANATVYPIERIWCDNEWDTMRSRGGKATTRVTLTV